MVAYARIREIATLLGSDALDMCLKVCSLSFCVRAVPLLPLMFVLFRLCEFCAFFRPSTARFAVHMIMLVSVTQGLYVTFLRHAKFVSEASAPSLTLMGTCIVDAYGIQPDVSYQFVFVYVR